MAPRIGYLLTAALAGRRYVEAYGLWRELDDRAQAEVISALGAPPPTLTCSAGGRHAA